MSTFRSMQETLVARAAATRPQPQVASLRDDLRDRARSSRRQELLANLRALRACAQRARLRKSCKLALLRCNKPSAKVLTIFTILALARPTPNHLHQFRLRPPDILAFIASTTAATISSARALSASSFTQPTFASTIAATISSTLAAVTAATTTAGASATAAILAALTTPPRTATTVAGASGGVAAPVAMNLQYVTLVLDAVSQQLDTRLSSLTGVGPASVWSRGLSWTKGAINTVDD